jgi:hypothetical protein
MIINKLNLEDYMNSDKKGAQKGEKSGNKGGAKKNTGKSKSSQEGKSYSRDM